MSDDFTANTSTTGTVAVGGTAAGVIETGNDFDWFAVELVAGKTYVIDLEGSDSGGGTLDSTVLRGIYDAGGDRIAGTQTTDGGDGDDARLTFTATESGTYYIAARGYGNATGTYTVRVTETASDDTRAGATELGDITDFVGPRFPEASLDGDGDQVEYFKFTLTESKNIGLGLRQQDANADLFLEDADGNVLHSSTAAGTANERISETLLAGTYYVRVEAQEEGENDFRLRYGVTAPDPDVVAALEQARDGTANVAPAFDATSYTLDLAENADGSTNRVALGIVSATDPEGSTLTYSIAAGNADDRFEINSSTGALSYKGAGEDYESGTTSYELTVRASDGDLHSDMTVTVNVTDVPEEPAFAEASYTFDLAENADGSTDRLALGTVSANDPESAAVTYSIEGGNSDGLFAIDSQTGALSYRGTGEDYESGTTNFELTVRASDGSLHSDVTVTVNVTDVQEQTIVEQQVSETQTSVSEPDGDDLPEDTSTTGRVAVGGIATGNIGTSGDRDWFAVELVAGRTYTIDLRGSRTNDGTLSDPYLRGIHDANGNLIKNTTNDDGGEGYNSRLTFTATESGIHYIAAGAYSGWGTYEVEVTDTSPQPEGEAPAFAAASYAFALAENADGSTDRVALGTVSATDPEDGTVTYSIEAGNGSDLFEIDRATGALAYKGTGEDFESDTTSYELTVRASDGGLHADVTVTVNVTDVEDTVPAPLLSVSEPDGGDFPNDTSTTGRVAVGDTATGNIETWGDRDWFAVELEAGQSYTINLRGSETGDGTLRDPYLRGIHDAEGNLISGTSDDDSGAGGRNSRLTFTPTEGGTYYIAAGAAERSYNYYHPDLGTYEVEVTDISSGVEDDFAASTATTGSIEVGGTTTGEIEYRDDRDWFAVELVAGKTYTIELKGSDTRDGTLRDPYLRGIHDANGSLISGTAVDDGGTTAHGGDGRNSRLTFTAAEGGTYYIAAGAGWRGEGTYEVEVWEDDFASSTETTGTVEVGGSATGEIDAVKDNDWFAVELEAGKTYRIDVHGALNEGGTLALGALHGVYDADGNRLSHVHDPVRIAGTTVTYLDGSSEYFLGEDVQVFFTPEEDGTYYVAASEFGSRGSGTYTVRVTEIEDDFPRTTDTDGTVEVGGTATGEIEYEGDRDWFAVELTAGETYKVELLGSRSKAGTLLDPYIRGIHDADGRRISDTTDYASGPNSNSEVFFTPDEDGTYYVAAGSYLSGLRDEDVGTYTLQVSIDDFRDDTDTTGTVTVGGSATGEIEVQADHDWFAVTLEAGKTYQIDMEGSPTGDGTLANPFLRYMRDANGDQIVDTHDRDSGEGLNARATFTPDEDGTYYVVAASGGHMHADDSHGRSLGTYTLSVEELVDAI